MEEYDDELCLMYVDLQHPPAGVAAQLEPVERLLGLSGVGNCASGPERQLFPREYFDSSGAAPERRGLPGQLSV